MEMNAEISATASIAIPPRRMLKKRLMPEIFINIRIQASAAGIGGRFGMNQQAADLGSVEFEGAFQCGDDGMDLSHGQIVRQGAVAAYLDAIGSVAMGAGYEDLVDVENLRKGRGSAAEADFELAVTFDRCRPLNSGGLALDVGNDGRDSGDFAAHLGFEPGSQGVGVAQGHGLVDFEVL